MKNMKSKIVLLLCVCLLSSMLSVNNASAAVGTSRGEKPSKAKKPSVGVITGATPINQGMANHPSDFTIYNDKIAASFAVGSNNYWNMTNGSILDVAVMKDGKFGIDLVNDVEFLNDFWTATGSFNGEDLLNAPKGNITYSKDKNKVVVTAKTRYWTAGHKQPLNVTIEYTLETGKNYISLKTTVENPEGNEAYQNLHSGYSISTLAANMYGPFGYYPDKKITGIRIGADSDVNEKLGNFVLTYGKNYAVSVQLDGANAYKGSSGYKDLYVNQTIEPGKTYSYTGELLVADKGETTPVIQRYLEKDKSISASSVKGIVKDSKGKAIAGAYVIVSKKGSYKETVKSSGKDTLKKDIMQPLVWKITDKNGKFDFKMPNDEYQIHVEAAGYTPSDAQTVSLTETKNLEFAVKDGAKAVINAVDENGKAIDVKVTVSGVVSTVKSLGGTVFFTDPKNNKAEFDVAAPETPVTFTITRDSDFESLPVVLTKTIKPGDQITENVTIPTLIKTSLKNWYSMDNHQHSNFGDGATPITDLFKAQIAAGLDFNLVSDHDSVMNNAAMAKLAKAANRSFISSLEVSPGWGHWGILGVDYTKKPISPNLVPAEIIKAGHAMGALVVVNHPYSDYGFFNNRDGVKGGYDKGSDDFDLLELQSTLNLSDKTNMDKKALDAAMEYWNKGMKKYLSAGSDQHDATSGLYPGIIRLYAHINGATTTEAYLKALKDGQSYVTMGPIFTPTEKTMFGSTQSVKTGEKLALATEIQAVNGLTRIDVYSEGKIIASKEFGNTKDAVSYTLEVSPTKNTWYSFVAVDGKAHYAVTNPVWVNVTDSVKSTK